MASTKFINECKNDANSNRLGKISVETIKKVIGTKLELSNTLDKKISPRLKGYTKQNIYYGKNNFDVESIISSDLTKIINKETSSFKFTNHWASELMNDTKLKELLEPSTYYTASAKVTLISKPADSEITGGNHGNIMILYKAGETSKGLLATTLDIKNNWKVGETKELTADFSTPADLTGWKILTYSYLTAKYGVGEFRIDYMMIRKQGENDTFEPYVGGKKNLLKLKQNPSVSQGITSTLNENGSISYNGTPTTNWANISGAQDTDVIYPGTYTISVNKKLPYYIIFRSYDTSGNRFDVSIPPNTLSTTFTSIDKVGSYYIFLSGLGTNYTYNDTIYLKLTRNRVISPGLDYPQEINVGRGKNLFNKDLYTYDYITQNNTGNVVNYKDIPIYVGKANTEYFVSTSFLNGYTPYGKSLMYVLIGNIKTANDGYVSIGHTGYNTDNATYNKSIISDENGYLYFRAYKTLSKALYDELMANVEVQIEEGSKKSKWLPYNTIESKSKTRNLYPSSNDIPVGYYASGVKDAENTHNGDISIRTSSAWAGPWISLKEVIPTNNLKVGDKVTYSIYFKTNFIPTKTMSFTMYRFTSASGNKTVYVPVSEVKPGEWIRLSFEFEINEYSLTSERARIEADYYDKDDPYYFGNNRTNYIWFASPQFEVGELTDYQVSKENSTTYNLGNNFLADKDYIQDGVLHKNIGKVVLNGSESGWRLYKTTNGGYKYALNNWASLLDKQHQWSDPTNYYNCDHFIFSNEDTDTMDNGLFVVHNLNNTNWIFFTSDIASVDQWKVWLKENPVTVYYELEKPEQIPLETTGELRTYESNTIISNDSDIEMEVEYSSWDTEITNGDNLTDVSVEDSCYVDGQIIGTTFEKKATSQLIAVPNDVDLIDKKIKVEIGVKYGDLSNEMVKMGNYTIERPKDEQTENFTQITAYDDFNSLDNPYVCNLDFSKDVTIADFYIDVCNQLELTPMKTTFLNSDIKVTANPFVNKETLRVVLQEIEKVSCTFSEIDYETNKIDLVWLSENEEPDYEFATSDYTTLEGGKITYGPVNCLVIKESQIEGENTVRQDDESIKTNGETQIAIQDSYFLFTQALREQAIDNIWNRVKGLTYVDCKLITSYGKPFLKVGKKIRVNVNDGRVFDTYVLKHTFKYDGAFESTIESPVLTKQETKVKSKSISESIRLTEIRVDKAEGNIKATTKKVESIDTTVNNNYQDIINKFGDYTPTNKVVEIENSIEQLQTDTYTKTEINTKLTDGSVTKVMTTSGTFDENGMHYEKTGAPTKSTINESGVNVESSTTGEELLFAGYDKELEQTIVRTENLTVRNYLVIGSNSRIEDYEDENGNAGGGIFIL